MSDKKKSINLYKNASARNADAFFLCQLFYTTLEKERERSFIETTEGSFVVKRLPDIVKNNEGVWISTRVFYIVGSLSLLSIITIVIEIAFYVYLH